MTTQELEYLVKVNDRDLAELKTRAKDVHKALGSDLEAEAGRGSAAMSKFGGVAKGLAIGLAGAGVASLAGAAKLGWDEFKQGQAVAAQTAAVLKSTGGAANVTAGEISNLSGALLRKSGVDDEAIQSGANLLLTFTGIRNEAGKGNDIFSQTTKTMLDMSVALGQDTKSSALQLGKALNDPIKGVTALQRVGVSFTESQKDQIKALVESGNVMGAQKLILGELNKEFGGSAEAAGKTLPGQLNVLKETFSNVAGEAVGAVIPALTGILQGIVNNLPAIESFVQKIAGELMPVFKTWWGFIQANLIPIVNDLRSIFTAAVTKIVGILEENKPALTEIWKNVTTLLHGVASVLEATVIPILKFALEEVLPKAIAIAIPILAKLSEGFRVVGAIVSGAGDAVGAVEGALRSVAKFVAAGWAKIESGLTLPVKAASAELNGFRALLDDIWNVLKSIASAAESAFSAVSKVTGIGGAVKGVLGHIPGFAEGVTGFAGGLAIVGENGPELVRLPAGSDVIPNSQARGSIGAPRGLSGGGGLSLSITVERWIGGAQELAYELAPALITELRRAGFRGVDLSFAGG